MKQSLSKILSLLAATTVSTLCSGPALAKGAPSLEPVLVEGMLDVNVVNDQRIQVSGGRTVPRFEQEQMVFIVGRESGGQFTRVPVGFKLVVTDFVLSHNVSGGTDILGANIRTAPADSDCDPGSPKRQSLQFKVGAPLSVVVSLTTGLEVYAGERVCLGTGGSVINDPDLEVTYRLIGYLVPD